MDDATAGWGYLALAGLILLILPVIVLPWEGRKVPDALYTAIAAAGIVVAMLQGGPNAAMAAAATGATTFLLIAAFVTTIRIILNLRILTGGHIKLLAAGSTWLGVTGALAMIVIAFGTLFAIAVFQRMKSMGRRPDFSVIAALAILCVSIQQTLP